MANEILRVTQVLSLFSNMWKIPAEVLARKAQIGTDLHQAMCAYLIGPSVHIDQYEIPADARPYLNSFHEWTKEKKYSVLLWEERITNEELGLSGQMDAVFNLDGVPTLVDWKTSAKDDPVTWRLQGTAYVELLRRGGYEVGDTFYFLKLRKDGKKAETFAYKYTAENWEIFMKAMDCARFHHKWKGEIVE